MLVGSDGTNPNETNIAIGQLQTAVDLFKSPEDVDISLVLTGCPEVELMAKHGQII